VKEKRIYGSWGRDVSAEDAIIVGKKALNDLHAFLGDNGFTEVYVDQVIAPLTATKGYIVVEGRTKYLV
jgi:hypothetical protein